MALYKSYHSLSEYNSLICLVRFAFQYVYSCCPTIDYTMGYWLVKLSKN